MRNVVKRILFISLILLCFFTGFVSCGQDNGVVIKDEQNTSLKEADSEIDYNSFQNKIWITKLNLSRSSSDSVLCSFYITNIKDGNIEGKIKTVQLIEKEYCYQDVMEEMTSLPFEGSFSGMIQGDAANCKFEDNRGYSGNMSLVFQETDKISMTIDADYSGTYLFTPWKLEEIKGLMQENLKSVPVELDDFGKVQIVSGNIEQADKIYPCVYLTDMESNILYQFKMGYAMDIEVSNLSLKDLNEDGYVDVSIELEAKKTDVEKTVWNFYRQSEGVFEREITETDNLSTEQAVDYSKYKEKIWYLDYDSEFEGVVFKKHQFSFYFSQFCDGKVYGRCRLGDLVRKDWYDDASRLSYEYGNTSMDGYLYGEIVNGVAVCRFWDQRGNEGWLTVQDWGENSLEAKFEWTRKNPDDAIMILGEDGTYFFHTWNLDKAYDNKLENELEIADESIYKTDMQYWGQVQLVTLSARHVERKYYRAYAYLMAVDGDILYEFDLWGACKEANSVMVSNVEIGDYNKDGLEDIIITVTPTYGEADSKGQNTQSAEKVYFYQQENGRFARVIDECEEEKEKTMDDTKMM